MSFKSFLCTILRVLVLLELSQASTGDLSPLTCDSTRAGYLDSEILVWDFTVARDTLVIYNACNGPRTTDSIVYFNGTSVSTENINIFSDDGCNQEGPEYFEVNVISGTYSLTLSLFYPDLTTPGNYSFSFNCYDTTTTLPAIEEPDLSPLMCSISDTRQGSFLLDESVTWPLEITSEIPYVTFETCPNDEVVNDIEILILRSDDTPIGDLGLYCYGTSQDLLRKINSWSLPPDNYTVTITKGSRSTTPVIDYAINVECTPSPTRNPTSPIDFDLQTLECGDTRFGTLLTREIVSFNVEITRDLEEFIFDGCNYGSDENHFYAYFYDDMGNYIDRSYDYYGYVSCPTFQVSDLDFGNYTLEIRKFDEDLRFVNFTINCVFEDTTTTTSTSTSTSTTTTTTTSTTTTTTTEEPYNCAEAKEDCLYRCLGYTRARTSCRRKCRQSYRECNTQYNQGTGKGRNDRDRNEQDEENEGRRDRGRTWRWTSNSRD